MPRRVATGVDPKRLAMLVAVLARHARLPLGQADVFVNVAGGVRIEEPGADLAVCLAVASAARGAPVLDGLAAFGEVGLTGRLRPVTQAERRLEECAKLGLGPVLLPAERSRLDTRTRSRGADRARGARRGPRKSACRDRLVRSEQGLFAERPRKPLETSRFSAPSCYSVSRSPADFSPAGVLVKRGGRGEARLYKVGDKVVYPHHGAGSVVKKEVREILGQKREYLTIKITHNEMVVNVPTENAERVGLRRVINEKMVTEVVKALTGSGTQMPKNWNRRFKHNRDKMKTGDVLELAEVVRNLALRDHEKGLSTGEKQMFVKAKKILASELMYAKQMDEEKTHIWLDDVLSGVDKNGKRRAKTRVSVTA